MLLKENGKTLGTITDVPFKPMQKFSEEIILFFFFNFFPETLINFTHLRH